LAFAVAVAFAFVFAFAVAFAFLVVILTLSVAEGEEPASRSRSAPVLSVIPEGNLLSLLGLSSFAVGGGSAFCLAQRCGLPLHK
jgi:hypothetical protein